MKMWILLVYFSSVSCLNWLRKSALPLLGATTVNVASQFVFKGSKLLQMLARTPPVLHPLADLAHTQLSQWILWKRQACACRKTWQITRTHTQIEWRVCREFTGRKGCVSDRSRLFRSEVKGQPGGCHGDMDCATLHQLSYSTLFNIKWAVQIFMAIPLSWGLAREVQRLPHAVL